MKKNKISLFWAFVFLLGFNITAGIYYFLDVKDLTIEKTISPIPDLFKDKFLKSVEASDFWKPYITGDEIFNNPPLISAKSAIVYDLTTNKLLYGENIDTPLPMASLTKIMTAILVLENMDLDNSLVISKGASEIGENSMGVSEGEILRVKDLLYGLLLPSGNDAAESLAEGSPYGRETFLYLMNKKAEDIGLSSTRFTNPSGLEGDGHQYSTAKELLILTRYALQNEEFAKIVSTYEHIIPAANNNKEYYLYNETNLLTSYPGVKGVKTGFTDEAGLCLVTYLEHKDHKIIGVILNSANRRAEMRELLNYALKSLGEEPPDQITH